MEPSYGGYEDRSGFLYHSASVETDEPFYCVWWYINGVYVGWRDGGNVKTEVHFSPTPSDYPGSPLGITYTIKAEVGWLEDNGDAHFDSASYDVSVYSIPNIDEGFGNRTFAWGHAKVDVEWNGLTAEAIGYGSISNNTAVDVRYGISIRYHVAKVWPNGHLRETLDLLKPPIIKIGVIRAKDEDKDRDLPPLSKSYTLRGGKEWMKPGSEFIVEAKVDVEAYFDIEKKDLWRAEDCDSLIIPDENN